jgi:hypothetical protein
MIDSTQVVYILSRSMVEQQLGEVDAAFPALKAAFVHVCPDIGIVQAWNHGFSFVFGGELHAYVEELSAR